MEPQQIELSLEYRRNGTGHGDLILSFAGNSWLADSYYLALDDSVPLNRDSDGVAHVRTILRRLIDQWVAAADRLASPGTIYLPYDFSDQYTAWLRCIRAQDEVSVCWGWSDFEGWQRWPSDMADIMTSLTGFRPKGPELRVPYVELVEAVHAVLAAQD